MKLTILSWMVMLTSITLSYAQQETAQQIEGSPYLDENYVQGEIYFGNAGLTKAPVRYNAYQDLLEYQQNGKALVLDPSTKIKKVQMGDITFIVEKFAMDGKTKYGFLNLLDTGKVSLLSKKAVKYQAAMKGKALDGGDLPAKFSRSADTYFLKVGEGELKEVGSLKELIANLPDKQDEIKQYAKQEKISPKKEAELRQLIRYYNSL